MAAPDGLVAIAHIRRSRGNRGEVIADSLTSHPERFESLSRVWLVKPDDPESAREAQVEDVWLFRGAEPVFRFAGVTSISEAESLAGYDVCVPAEERVQLAEGEYFFDDLVGCVAYGLDSERIGEVTGWQESDSGQVWFEVLEELPGGERRTFLVPFHRSIFREIEVEAKAVRLDLPDGLRELNDRAV